MYKDKYNPEISVRTSMADYKKKDWLVNLPLYVVEEIGSEINRFALVRNVLFSVEKQWKIEGRKYVPKKQNICTNLKQSLV